MTPEEALSVADQVLYVHTNRHLTDIQRLILLETLAGKRYEQMQGYATQHIKNEGKELWEELSKALGEKVSKTSFRGPLEKRLRSTQIVPKLPSLSSYAAETWAGRDTLIDVLLNQLHRQTRLICLTGISGIGKTALAECLAVKFQNPDTSFHRVSFDIVGQSQDFTAGAAEILAELGDKDLDPKELNDPKRLSDRLLRKLQMHQYWLQLDALERLLNSEHPTAFTDPYWLGFFQRCLSSSDFPSRLVLTAQAIPSEFARFEDDYPHAWYEETLRGLSDTEQLELFGKHGITVDRANYALLSRIGQTYEGHPLVLRVIAGEIRKDFSSNVVQYWERYGSEFEQVARELQSQRVNPALYNQILQKRVRQRVEISLKRLPENALSLLCRSAVYRRPVLESFWLVMLGDRSSFQQEAYQVLGDRALIEQEGIHQGQLLIRQHNLIRDVAYDLLRKDFEIWETAERKAAELWLSAYEPASDAPKLELVRSYLEAFHHYYEVEDWTEVNNIFTNQIKLTQQKLDWQLFIWGYYQELIQISSKLLSQATPETKIICLLDLGNSYCCLGNQNKAIESYQEALIIAREISDRRGEAKALGNLGIAYRGLSDYHRAIDYHQQHLGIAREISDRQGEGNALGNLGTAYRGLSDYHRAIDYHQQHLGIAREIGDLRGEGNALGSLGNVYDNLGNYRQAIDYHQQYLMIANEVGDRQGEAIALGNLGNAYDSLGDYWQAIDCRQQSLAVAREIGDRQGEGRALGNLGNTYNNLGNCQQAINYHQQHLAIAREIGDRQGEGRALGNLGSAYKSLGDYQQAIDYHQQCLTIAREIGYQRGEVIALDNLGSSYCALSNYSKAVELHNQSLTIAHKIGDWSGESYALAGLGEAFIKLEQYSEASEALQNALEICRETGERSLEAEIAKNLAELHYETEQINRALEYCKQALAIATELGIPLAEECRKLKEELEQGEG